MIPEAKSAGVRRGLQEAFGAAGFDEIRKLTKGHTTSLVFRMAVEGSPYLLKIILRADDPSRHYVCMRAAAEAGVAPRVWYTSVEDKISITDFVEEVPLTRGDALVRMASTLRALHALPPFPLVEDWINTTCLFLTKPGAARDGFVQRFKDAKVLAEGECEEVLARYREMLAAYECDGADLVSSHNDLFKPDNALFDGQRVWLADWEAAFLNDRYADLAVVATLVVTNEADEESYLREYFGGPADAYQRARFFLMQQLSLLFYSMAFLPMGVGTDWDCEEVPDFEDFHRRIWAGEVTMTEKAMKVVYGKVYMKRFLENVRSERYGESLRVVLDRHARL